MFRFWGVSTPVKAAFRKFARNLPLMIVLGLCVLGISACNDDRARIIVDNQSQCPAISVKLTNTHTSVVTNDRLGPGTKREYVVEAGVFYHYEFDYTVGGPTQDGYRCTEIKSGEVLVQAGNNQTFTLRSERLTPTPKP